MSEPTDRQLEVARLIVEVGRSFHVFNYGDKHYLPLVIDRAMQECEAAFTEHNYEHAEHLAKVVGVMVARAGPQFVADPKAYSARHELCSW